MKQNTQTTNTDSTHWQSQVAAVILEEIKMGDGRYCFNVKDRERKIILQLKQEGFEDK